MLTMTAVTIAIVQPTTSTLHWPALVHFAAGAGLSSAAAGGAETESRLTALATKGFAAPAGLISNTSTCAGSP